MCSYIVKTALLPQSCAKTGDGWGAVARANVYYDHPFHSPLDHVLGVDVLDEAGARRIALELSPEAARALVAAIEAALENGEREHGMALGREEAAV